MTIRFLTVSKVMVLQHACPRATMGHAGASNRGAWAVLLLAAATGSMERAAAFGILPSPLSARPSVRPTARWLRAGDRARARTTPGSAPVSAGVEDGNGERGEVSPPSDSLYRPSITLKVALDSAGGVDDMGDKDSFRFTW
jgi:hypothetical protein